MLSLNTSGTPGPQLSMVIPVYFNEGVISRCMRDLKNQVLDKNPQLNAEIIFVDDGSQDGSLEELLRLRTEYGEVVKVAKLTRNFGQVSAIMAGLALASGDCVVIMSADQQEPAELINDMLAAFFGEKVDIVIAARKGRDESLLRKWTSTVFYRIIRKLSFPNMPIGGFDFVLLSRRAAAAILCNREANPFLQGQILWTGFRTKILEYHRRKREIGTSKWTFGRKLTYLIDGVMGYSFFPIRLMSGIGALIALLGFIYAGVILVVRLVWGIPIEGWTPLMITLLVVGGMQMIMLGTIGEYLWRILAQTRGRELYVIDSLYGEFPTGPGQA